MSKRIICLLFLLFAVIFQTVSAADTLTFPANMERIEDSAFEGDTSLDEAVLPDGIKYIGYKAFASSSLRKVNLPASLEFIAFNAFDRKNTEFTYTSGTYAEDWVNNYIDLKSDNNDPSRIFIFEDNDEIRLGHTREVRLNNVYLEKSNFDTLQAKYGGRPTWSIETYGNLPVDIMQNDQGYAVDVYLLPDYSQTAGTSAIYTVICEWEDASAEFTGTVNFETLGTVTGSTIPDILEIQVGVETVLSLEFTPADIIGSKQQPVYVQISNCRFSSSVIQSHTVSITPFDAGQFLGTIELVTDNVVIAKEVLFKIADENGNVPDPDFEIKSDNDPAVMYLFADDNNIGLGHTSGWVNNFFIEKNEFDLLYKLYGELPEWSLVEGDSYVEIRPDNAGWGTEIYLTNYPASAGTQMYTVQCSWGNGDFVKSATGTINFETLTNVPTGSDIWYNYEMQVGQEYAFTHGFEPTDLTDGWQAIYVRIPNCDYSSLSQNHTLHLTPYEAGQFLGTIELVTDNVVIAKEVLFKIADENGTVPDP